MSFYLFRLWNLQKLNQSASLSHMPCFRRAHGRNSLLAQVKLTLHISGKLHCKWCKTTIPTSQDIWVNDFKLKNFDVNFCKGNEGMYFCRCFEVSSRVPSRLCLLIIRKDPRVETVTEFNPQWNPRICYEPPCYIRLFFHDGNPDENAEVNPV